MAWYSTNTAEDEQDQGQRYRSADVMDEMGTDALRFTLLVGSTPGNDMNLSIKKVEANRNFATRSGTPGAL